MAFALLTRGFDRYYFSCYFLLVVYSENQQCCEEAVYLYANIILQLYTYLTSVCLVPQVLYVSCLQLADHQLP